MADLFNQDGSRIKVEPTFPIDEMRNKITDPKQSTVTGALFSSRYIEPLTTATKFLRGGEVIEGQFTNYPRVREEGFDPEEYVKKNFPQYLSDTQIWIRGNNEAHVNSYIKSHEIYLNNRAIESASSGLQQFFGEIRDPSTYVPLKIFTTGIGKVSAVKRITKNVAVGTGFVGVQNTGRYVDDPTFNTAEFGMTSAFAGAFVAGFGEGLSVFNKAVLKKALVQSYNDTNVYAKKIGGLSKEELKVGKPEKRKLGSLTDEELINQKTILFDKLQKADSETNLNALDAIDIEIGVRKVEGNESDYNIAPSLFTDSAIYDMISTPLKRISKGAMTRAQEFAYKIAYDSGVLLRGHQKNKVLPSSVFQRNKLHDGKLKGTADNLLRLFGKDKEGGSQTFLDLDVTGLIDKLSRNKNTFDNWLEEVAIHYIDTPKVGSKLTKAQTEALDHIEVFFKEWRVRLEETGQLRTKGGLQREQLLYTRKLRLIENKFNNKKILVNKFEETILGKEATRINDKLTQIKFRLKEIGKPLDDAKYPIQLDDAFFPRFWDRNAIKKNKVKFKEILREYLLENPDTLFAKRVKKGEPEIKRSTEENIDARVLAIYNDILTGKQSDEFFGHGITKHLNKRKIAIPNHKVIEFIETNPLAVMKAYNQKTAPVYEFRKANENLGFDEAVDELRFNLRMDGASEKKINAAIRDITHLYESVTHNILRNPDAWNHKIVAGMKNLAQLAYLGSAGFTTITEPAKIIMEHGFKPTFNALKSVLDDPLHWASRAELQKAGEGLDYFLGSVAQRVAEAQSVNPLGNNIWDQGKNAFYVLNGLTWATRLLKDFDAVVRQHSILEMAVKVSKTEASKMELEYLARYGINKSDAILMSKMPYQTSKNGFILANTDAWKNAEIKTKFQLALSDGVLNTILMGTPADKPIVMSGIFYVPMRVARQFGMKEDVKVKGYARIENSLLSLPFQFYSYMMASVNKTAAGYAHGQVKGKASGFLAALGLGYMLLKIKTSDKTFDNMTNRDKFFRAFDYGGVTAIYNDMLYTALHTTMELTGKNITGGLISPKYNTGNASPLETVVGAFGAGPSVTFDLASGVKDLLSGNWSDGASTVSRNLPFTGLFWLEPTVNDIVRNWTGRY
tara:strand:+ start:4696 stop:8085 length:3390 start_codon:yes stop_codon:yes gene_type:complete